MRSTNILSQIAICLFVLAGFSAVYVRLSAKESRAQEVLRDAELLAMLK